MARGAVLRRALDVFVADTFAPSSPRPRPSCFPAMLPGMNMTDQRKIGLLLIGLGLLFLVLGVVFMFDSGLLAIGNVLFLLGWPFVVGLSLTFQFFNPFNFSEPDWAQRVRGKLLFWAGVGLVLSRWAVLGIVLEVVGMVMLFGRVVSVLMDAGRATPGLGPFFDNEWVRRIAGWFGAKTRDRAPV